MWRVLSFFVPEVKSQVMRDLQLANFTFQDTTQSQWNLRISILEFVIWVGSVWKSSCIRFSEFMHDMYTTFQTLQCLLCLISYISSEHQDYLPYRDCKGVMVLAVIWFKSITYHMNCLSFHTGRLFLVTSYFMFELCRIWFRGTV